MIVKKLMNSVFLAHMIVEEKQLNVSEYRCKT
jgi:hypothetical protein